MVRVAVLIAVGLAAGCGGGGHRHAPARAGGGVVVPRVVGLSQSRAECRLHAVGLRWRIGAQKGARSEPIVPCGRRNVHVSPDPTVKRQRPAAGRRAPRGSVVALEDACTLLRFRSPPSACS